MPVFVAAMFALTLSTFTFAETPKFKLVTENFVPFNFSVNSKNFEHDESNISGICTEIVKEIFQRAELEYKLKLRQWSYAFDYAKKQPNRGVFCTSRTDERNDLFKWVGPMVTNDWVIFGLDNFKGSIKSDQDLKNYKVGGYKGDALSNYLKNKNIKVSELTDDRLNPKRLKDGMIDLWVSSKYTGPKLARDAGINNLKVIYTIKESELYLALHKGTDDQWINKLNDELSKLKSSGIVKDITRKYF